MWMSQKDAAGETDDRRRRETKNKDDKEEVREDRWRARTHQGQLM